MAQRSAGPSPFWRKYHEFFYAHDGSLPEIQFTAVSDNNLPKLFDRVRSHASSMSSDGFWDLIGEKDVAVAAVPNAAALVAAGTAESFHVVFEDVQQVETTLSALGVFVLRGELALDYQPGSEWDEVRFLALLDLICDLRMIAPEATVSTEPAVVAEFRIAFEREVARHCASRREQPG